MEKTFHFQSQLPDLPIPKLNESCEKYLNSLKPILSQDKFEKSKALVNDFVKPGGEGETLYNLLREYGEKQRSQRKSWLEEWWLEYGYLRGRYPLPVNLTCYFMIFPQYSNPGRVTQCHQAARWIRTIVDWKILLDNEEIPVEKAKGKPLDMSQLQTIFTTTRNPGLEIDTLVTVKPKDHVIVMCKNQFFLVNLKNRGDYLSISEIESQLELIVNNSAQSMDIAPRCVSAFTTLPRTQWAEIRNSMMQDDNNRKIFDHIEHSMFMVTLDDQKPSNSDEFTRMTGTGHVGRWYDKIFNLVVYANSEVGFPIEHTPCDAPALGSMIRWVADKVSKLNTNSKTAIHGGMKIPEKLTFNLTSKQHEQLADAVRDHLKEMSFKDFKILHFNKWGTNRIQKAGVSPDTFIQMVLQLSYYRMHGKGTATYETGHTRYFLHGRTETVRTFSEEVLQFLKSFDTPSSGEQKMILFQKAVNGHIQYMADAVSGNGCDRLMFGLRIIHDKHYGKSKPMHGIFLDPAFSESTHYRLSTSNVPGLELFGGFGNAVEDGYGIPYMMKPNQIAMRRMTCQWIKESPS
eukprot:TRINITY_DN926_c0_g1_i9.p1 TRINITY_DN926_c0_g1~~TRINITY_DN926_c0_g1_i9.p1  ORF type:complete len:572 (+),score=70.34 TRINITY_DN926_c0_g1_i9:40-1755(+)